MTTYRFEGPAGNVTWITATTEADAAAKARVHFGPVPFARRDGA